MTPETEVEVQPWEDCVLNNDETWCTSHSEPGGNCEGIRALLAKVRGIGPLTPCPGAEYAPGCYSCGERHLWIRKDEADSGDFDISRCYLDLWNRIRRRDP